jgi:arginase
MSVPSRNISICGIPMDLGQSHRGVDLGAGALRYAGLADTLRCLGHRVYDRGDLYVPVRDAVIAGREGFIAAISQVCAATCNTARELIHAGETPIFLGGDHTISIGTIAGISEATPCGVLWIDAHGDFNTPATSLSGNYHGMPLAVLLGDGAPALTDVGRPGPKLDPADVVIIGLRDLDVAERDRLKGSGISIYTMRDIDERGMATVAHEALDRLRHRHHLHVSLDIDSIDPLEAPGAGTLVPGGLTYREAQLLMEIIADRGGPDSLDIVEINPIIDVANRTARLAVDLAASLFGKRIL